MRPVGLSVRRPVGRRLQPLLIGVSIFASCRATAPTGRDQAVEDACSFAVAALERETARPATVKTDTTFLHPFLEADRRGCVVHLEDSTGEAPLVQMREAFQREGWASQVGYMADGPDGSVEGFLRSGTLCTIRGEWDGGDDTDSTYVPAPGYRFTVNCWRAAPEDPR